MSVEICAVVDRVPGDLAPARALGTGPYVVVTDASDGAIEERLASRLALFGALRKTSCLPFRLGSVVADDEAALSWLGERRVVIDQALTRAAARVEFDLHLSPASGKDAPARQQADGPGTRHLRSLAARYAQLSADQSRRALDACRDLPAVEETAVVAEDGFIAFLVADANAFAHAARAIRLDGARWSGPWPAFTFAARWLEVA